MQGQNTLIRILPSARDVIHRPENFGDVALLLERREDEWLELERFPVDGGRKRADGNLDRSLHELIAHHQERQKLRQHQRRLRASDHRVRRADAVHFRHRQLALIGAAAAENNIALPKPQLGADDIAALAPMPDVQAAGIEIIQPHVDFIRCVRRLHALVDALRKLAKRHRPPSLPIE